MTDKKKPKSFDEAYNKMSAEAEGVEDIPRAAPSPPPTAKPNRAPVDEEETGDDMLDAETDLSDPLEDAAEKNKDPEAVPEWIHFPVNEKWKIPPYKQIMFLRFKAAWTDMPHLGDRTIIFWSLSDSEEKLATKRTRGDNARTIPELTKAAIRAMGTVTPGTDDGLPMAMADWTGKLGPGNVDRFWNEIGSKCRTLVQNIYLRTHSLSAEETADFFLNCLSVRSAVVG